MSSEKEFDLDEWSKRDRNPYFDNGLLEMGRKEGFHKGQEQAAKRILELEKVEGLLYSLIRNIERANLEDSTMGIGHRMWIKKYNFSSEALGESK